MIPSSSPCSDCLTGNIADAVSWLHSWDAFDATSYEDPGFEGGVYINPPATRVATVADSSGNRPMHKDLGQYGAVFLGPPLPGPLWHPSSPVFNGRPCWQSDVVEPLGVFFDNIHSMLSPHVFQEQAYWFNIPQPWWMAILAARTGATGSESALIDGQPGATTMAADTDLNITTWNQGPPVTFGAKIINPTLPPALTPLLAIWSVNGATSGSFFDVTYRVAGELTTTRTWGGQGGVSTGLTAIHSGWSHENYTSAIGLDSGTPTDAEVNALRRWAAPYL